MKLTLNTESTGLLLRAKEQSGLNFNDLLKEAMQLLLVKYNKESYNKQEDHYDRTTNNTSRST